MGSSDPDGGDALSFDWTEPVLLNNETSPTSSFVAPPVSPGGANLDFNLVVTDDDPLDPMSSVADSVAINVRNVNDPPSCDLTRAVCSDSKISDSSRCLLWPPDHKMIGVSIDGVMGPCSSGKTILPSRPHAVDLLLSNGKL